MQELQIDVKSLPWIPQGPGTYYKLLRFCPATNHYSVILRLDAGTTFMAHYHLGAGEFVIMKGELHYADTVAHVGDYGYEPVGAVHAATMAKVDTELFFIGYGPIVMTNPDGSIAAILDGQLFRDMAAGAAEVVDVTAPVATA